MQLTRSISWKFKIDSTDFVKLVVDTKKKTKKAYIPIW